MTCTCGYPIKEAHYCDMTMGEKAAVLWKRNQKFLAPVFILLELVMHLYLVGYLVLIKASFAAIIFTAFELIMFIYLLWDNKRVKSEDG